jgi:glycosyltransferase involved in cell wall biosynthesis
MTTYCFVVQHSRGREGGTNVPSGTLTVVSELVKQWNRADRVLLLCNEDYANRTLLERLREHYGAELHFNTCPTVQDRLARLEHAGGRSARSAVQRLCVRLAAPVMTLRVLLRLKDFLVAEKVDVVYSHNGGYPAGELNRLVVVAAALAKVGNRFLIVHNFPDGIGRRRLPLWPFIVLGDRIVGRCAARVVSVSKAAAAALQEGRYLGRQVDCIYNGIALDGADRETPLPPPWAQATQGSPVVMFLGTIAPRKGLHVLIDALAQVRSPCKLIVYGSGPPAYRGALDARIARLGLERKVVFAGFDPEAATQVKHADVLVLPSLSYESFGMVLLEAMVYTKPVICSDTGGMKEVVEDGKTGLVVPAGDSTRLAEAIDQLLGDPARGRRLGVAGFERVHACFDIKRTVQQYVDLVE